MIDQPLWEQIKIGLEWLTDNKHWRDAEMNKKEGKAAKYASFEIRLLGKMKSYPDQAELLTALKALEYDPELKEVMEPAVEFELLTDPSSKNEALK